MLTSPGGKGANQATAIGKLGGDCAMLGKVGSDVFGEQMINNLKSYGVRTEHVTVSQCESGTALI